MTRRAVAVVAAILAIASACSSGTVAPQSAGSEMLGAEPAPQPGEVVELTVFAAASLKDVIVAVKAAFEAGNPNTALTISTDSSAALRTQIEEGAPADVFLSADTVNPGKLVDGGFASGGAVTLARNELTIIVPIDNPAAISSPADLARSGLKVIAAGDEVPITRYAAQLVANLAMESGYPGDFAARYAANIASKEDNVKAVVAKIELGEGDAGIVYVTDAKASAKVETIDVPDSAHVPATYAGVVVKASKHQDAAQAFLTWFAGPEGQAILATFGFLPPP